MWLNHIAVKILIRLTAVSALLMTIVPSFLHFTGKLPFEKISPWMAAGMIVWFLSGSLWLGRKSRDAE